MALTGSIVSPDGTEHVGVFALCYPLTLQVLPEGVVVAVDVHAWRSHQAHLGGLAELQGYPVTVELTGDDAEQAIGEAVSGLTAAQWSGDPAIDTPAAVHTVVGVIEDAVIAQRPEFSRAP